MSISLGRRTWTGLLFGIAASVMFGMALFIGSLFQRAVTFPTVHLLYPGAILRTHRWATSG